MRSKAFAHCSHAIYGAGGIVLRDLGFHTLIESLSGERGEKLLPGEIIIAGSLTPPQPIAPGEQELSVQVHLAYALLDDAK